MRTIAKGIKNVSVSKAWTILQFKNPTLTLKNDFEWSTDL